MNAPFEPAHSRFGGSTAARAINCPGSIRESEKVPLHLRTPSVFADRGSALHVTTSSLIERECTLADVAGRKIGEYKITDDDVANDLQPVLGWVDSLLDQSGTAYFIDHRVTFPRVPEAYGTLDLLARNGDTAHVVDFKYGQGVPVHALYPDGATNAQLLYYCAAARHTLPDFLEGVSTFVLTILQPRSVAPDHKMVSSVVKTHRDLDEFINLFCEAVEEAQSPKPRLEKGDHCRFCPGKTICPLHTGPIFALSMFEMPARSAPDYYQALSRGLTLFNDAKEIGKTLHDQAKQALHDGHDVPGYALSAGRTERSWQDENIARTQLLELGLTRDDIIAEEMRSVKPVESRARARSLKIPQELINSSRSGVSLVRAENAHAPILSRSERIQSWAEVIETIHKGES